MESEIVIDVSKAEISIALLEDKRLVELQKEARADSFSVGDIYLGRVKKIMPGLNAAFVDVGSEKDAFLHYLDLGILFNTQNKFFRQVISDRKRLPDIGKLPKQADLPKEGQIIDYIKQGQEIVVQIAKEPISTKGPRLSGEISFAGRFIVLIPFSDKVSISQKIRSGAERTRLRKHIDEFRPKNVGVIARTVAEGQTGEEIENEMKQLLRRWEDMIVALQKSSVKDQLHEESSRTVGILRDFFNPSFSAIYINDAQLYAQTREYVSLIAPEKQGIVHHYTGDLPIFDNFGITKQIKSSFGRAVTFKRGAYLIIEHTEALHVIDVNSGNRSKSTNSQEENAWDVNLAAAEEIARQLRLRDMGGIIVIDFIDMNEGSHRQLLHEQMRDFMDKDRAKHNILPLSKFGLMQITRQRVRPALDIQTSEACPVCFGKENIPSSLLFVDQLEHKMDYLVNTLRVKKAKLYVHPYVYAYLKSGIISTLLRWKVTFSWGIQLFPDQSLAFLQYRIIDSSGEEIDLKEELELK